MCAIRTAGRKWFVPKTSSGTRERAPTSRWRPNRISERRRRIGGSVGNQVLNSDHPSCCGQKPMVVIAADCRNETELSGLSPIEAGERDGGATTRAVVFHDQECVDALHAHLTIVFVLAKGLGAIIREGEDCARGRCLGLHFAGVL